MPSEVKRSFCIDSSGVRRSQRSSYPTEDTDEFPLISATKTSPRLVSPFKHTPNMAQFLHIPKKPPSKSTDFNKTRSSPAVFNFDRLQFRKVCKNVSSISCLEVFWLAFGM